MKKLLTFLACSAVLWAHPMGNFSVSHFSRLQLTASGVGVEYVLDLAEIPTFELRQTWKLDRSASPQELNARATIQAREWLNQLAITLNGRPVRAKLESVKATFADGAGNLPILRMEMRARVPGAGGDLRYEDNNYPERAGWKEIVVGAGKGVKILQVSQSDHDLSKALTQYPPDPTIAPPQDLRAHVEWQTITPLIALSQSVPVKSLPVKSAPGKEPAVVARIVPPTVVTIPQPHRAPAAVAPATMTVQGATAGSVTRGDFLSRFLHQRQLTLSMILIALAASFGLGAVHALTPGHGKAIVAAYLVGSRGTLKHAAFLGAMVTFTHTITVFGLGLATLFLFRFIVPEKITALLGALSGMSIVAIGAVMLYKRVSRRGHSHSHRRGRGHSHAHSHSHRHGHLHAHRPARSQPQRRPALATQHTYSYEPVGILANRSLVGTDDYREQKANMEVARNDEETSALGTFAHAHGSGEHIHAHVPEELSWRGLIALGASGGLVPCESALVLLLGAIALGRVGLGLLLLISFSLGLALVLMLIGVLVIYAKNLLPESKRSGGHPFFRWISVASPAIVMLVGLLMTAASLGWIQSKWMIG